MHHSIANVSLGSSKNRTENTQVTISFSPATMAALQKYIKAKGFLKETEAVRFIVNAVLSKEGLLQQQ
jgi:hypothetical protein